VQILDVDNSVAMVILFEHAQKLRLVVNCTILEARLNHDGHEPRFEGFVGLILDDGGQDVEA